MPRRTIHRLPIGEIKIINKRFCVIYARVSSKEQEKEGFSIPAQLKLLRDRAHSLGLTVLREFVDVETAKQSGRTQFGEMLKFLRTRRDCKLVLVEKTDRLYRNLKDVVLIEELDLEIHLVKENEIISRTATSHAKMVHGIKVILAKNYIDNLSEETRKGMREKAAQGIWPSNAPIGYVNCVGRNGKRGIEPDPLRAPIVIRLFELYATGEYTVRSIAKAARRLGLSFRKSGHPVNAATVHGILRNRIYTGDFYFDGQFFKGCHQALVSLELWQRVQEILSGRFTNRHRKVKHDFSLSQVMRCGHCGCSMVGELKKGRYIYYHCTGHKGRCPEPYVREETLLEQFAKSLGRIRLDAEIAVWMQSALRSSGADEKRLVEASISQLEAEQGQLQARLDAMYVDKLDGKISEQSFERYSRQWRDRIAEIQQSISAQRSVSGANHDQGVHILELAARAYELFLSGSPGQRRRLIRCVFSNCSWKDGLLEVEYRKPFDVLALSSNADNEKKPVQSVEIEKEKKWLLR